MPGKYNRNLIDSHAKAPGRQRDVAALTLKGLSVAAISEQLGLGMRTVKNYRSRAYRALGYKGSCASVQLYAASFVYDGTPPTVPLSALSRKELLCVEQLTKGLNNSEIGVAVGISVHMVRNYFKTAYDKLGLSSRLEVANWYLSWQAEESKWLGHTQTAKVQCLPAQQRSPTR